jgi:hypothetical protein
MKRTSSLIIIFAIILAACAPAVLPTATFVPTKTFTLTSVPPTITVMPSPTLTPVPTLIGGAVLKVAFVQFLDCHIENNVSCLVIGDFFTGKVDFKIPLQESRKILLRWSPDGKYLFYQKITGKKLEIYILNIITQQSKLLDTRPLKSGGVDNEVHLAVWSNDSQHLIYEVDDAARIGKSFVADINGSITELNWTYRWWLPDNQTVIDNSGYKTYNIQTKKEINTGVNIYEAGFSPNFVVIHGGKGKEFKELKLIPLPQSIVELQQFTSPEIIFATFAPELELRCCGEETRLVEISDNIVLLHGESNKGTFLKIIDLRKLPTTITVDDLTDEYPIILSPDKSQYLSGFCVYDKACKYYDANWKDRVATWMGFKLWNINISGTQIEIPFNNDLLQFKSVVHKSIGSIGQQEELDSIDFYWQP